MAPLSCLSMLQKNGATKEHLTPQLEIELVYVRYSAFSLSRKVLFQAVSSHYYTTDW